MKYKVCILAAGIGARMAPFTDQINKSLLPVNFKASLSHIIEKFDNNIEFVIAVGHLSETVKQYLECAHPDRMITIVDVDKVIGKGSGPGYSLIKCKEYLNLPFIFFASDTLVIEEIPPPKYNWMGVSKVLDGKNYCTAKISNDLILKLDDKTTNENKDAFVGVAGVRNHEVFFESLEKDTKLKNNELQVSNGFNALINLELKAYRFNWHDTGNMQGYIEANKILSNSNYSFDFSKSDEFLYFVGNKVIKYFKNPLIIENRYKRSKFLQGLCPTITSLKDSFYAYEKIKGRVLYDSVNSEVMLDLLHWLDSKLWKKLNIENHELKLFRFACFDFYYNKTLSRLDTYHERYNFKDQPSFINNHKVPSIEKMFNLLDWENLSNGIPSNFHGDLQFDNILLKNNGDFSLIDWRQDFSGIVDYGDQYYDLAKLKGGMQVSYKLIKQGKFSYNKDSSNKIKISHNLPKDLKKVEFFFDDYLIDKKLDLEKVNIIKSLIYLNMSPMHHEPFDHFIYNFGKLSLYKSLLECGKIPLKN
jgi:UTP-glucose-1-phosphate uridylyltransferase/thiamine kinase-like enzyme